MPNTTAYGYNPTSKKVAPFRVTASGKLMVSVGASTILIHDNFSAFPVSPDIDELAYARAGEGVYLINRKPSGLYRYSGSAWIKGGDLASYFDSDNFVVYDTADNSKEMGFDVSGITTGTKRTYIAPDKNGTLALLSDTGHLSVGYIDRLLFSWVTVSTVAISNGSCRDSTDIFNIINGGTLTADITTSGANGLDTGSEAGSTSYFCYIIADTDGVNAVASLLSLSATAPTLPSGYDVFRRIGWVRNNSSSDFGFFNCNGNDRNRRYLLGDTLTSLNPLSGGTATVYTDVDLSSFMPSTSTYVLLVINYLPNVATNIFRVRPNGSTTNLPITVGAVGSIPSSALSFLGLELATDSSQLIEYRVAASDVLDIFVYGFVDNI